MVVKFICLKCGYKTSNELEFNRHLNDIKYTCDEITVTVDDFMIYKIKHVNQKRINYRERMLAYYKLRFVDPHQLNKSDIKSEYLFLTGLLDDITQSSLEVKREIKAKHINALKQAREKLSVLYNHLISKAESAKFGKFIKKEVHVKALLPIEPLTLANIQKLESLEIKPSEEIDKVAAIAEDIVDDNRSVVSSRSSIVSSIVSNMLMNKPPMKFVVKKSTSQSVKKKNPFSNRQS